jgi:hypothetical protein
MNIISSVGHPRSDSVRMLMMDSSIHIWGTGVVLHVPQNSSNPVGKGLISWVDHMELNYDMILLVSFPPIKYVLFYS